MDWANFQWGGTHKRFLVARSGGTASSFLAKMLNSHPDVLCSHEEALKYHALGLSLDESIEKTYDWICRDTLHNAYVAAGDVGSAYIEHLGLLRRSDLPIKTGLLVRHPLLVYRVQKTYFDAQPFQLDEVQIGRIRACWPDVLPEIIYKNICFFWCMTVWIEGFKQADMVDVTIFANRFNDCEYLYSMSLDLTGASYPEELLNTLRMMRVNAIYNSDNSISDIFNNILSDIQRKKYLSYVDPLAELWGYHIN